MKKTILTGVMLIASSVIASGATCASFVVSDVTSIGSCTVGALGGDLTFSNFQVQLVGGTGPLVVHLFNVVGAGTSNVALFFNPGLFSGGPTDIHFGFEVSGPKITSVSLDGGAATGSINESVCTQQQNLSTGACGGTLLGQMVWGVGDGNLVTNIAPTSSIWVWKDILVEEANGHNSGFSQDFSTVPEPASLALLGSGLIGLGVLARRRRTKL